MKLKIEMSLDSAALTDEGPDEVARILDRMADRLPWPLKPTSTAILLHDANGNYVGSAEIVEDPEPKPA